MQHKKAKEKTHGTISLLSSVFEALISTSASVAEAVEIGYNILYACQLHSDTSPKIQCFWKAIQGQITETACVQLEHFEEDLNTVLDAFDHHSSNSTVHFALLSMILATLCSAFKPVAERSSGMLTSVFSQLKPRIHATAIGKAVKEV